ncbi:nucleoside-diphosphate kinase [candidate division WOR-3 bacterium]|nr:nucleoside-diphosphate kinase [candidate division WOR-3 bacterium]
MARQPEKTLLVIKPDAVKKGHIGAIISRLEQAEFKITGMVMKQLSRAEAEGFYAIHRGKDFFAGLVEFITSGPVVALLIEGECCQQRLREFVGATDPAQAKPGTIRAEFGTSVRMNAVHASNPEEDVNREINFFFPDQNQNPR